MRHGTHPIRTPDRNNSIEQEKIPHLSKRYGIKTLEDQRSHPFGDQLVPRKGLEPSPLARLVPETSASTNSATWAPGRFRLAMGFRLGGGGQGVNRCFAAARQKSRSGLVARRGRNMPVPRIRLDRLSRATRGCRRSVRPSRRPRPSPELTRWVRPPRPWRPSKLRFEVEAQRSPGAACRVHAEAHRAAGLAPVEAEILEDLVEALGLGLRLHAGRSPARPSPDAVMALRSPLDDRANGAQILDPAVGAGADEDPRRPTRRSARMPGCQAHIVQAARSGGLALVGIVGIAPPGRGRRRRIERHVLRGSCPR
jgi:hypothetical protein